MTKLIITTLLIATAISAFAIGPSTPAVRVQNGAVVAEYATGLPASVSYAQDRPYYRASHRHESDGIVPATFATVPDGMVLVSASWEVVDGVAIQTLVTETQAEADARALKNSVPESVTPRQIRLALLAMGVTPAMIEAQLNEIENETEKEAALIEWLYANSVKRVHPMIEAMGVALGLDSAGIDALFIQAAGYE